MSFKTKAGRLWTDSVAYVALLTGAGLSIAGNVANVIRTRGAAVDTLDIVLAVAFPALVVLMVEVFVSARWRGLHWSMQVLRWVGTLAIGAVAMRVSWTHLHELMLSRGQAGDVATFGPLAIDALAIMATALILAGRGKAPAQDKPAPVQPVSAPVQVDMPADADESADIQVMPGDIIHVESDASMLARDMSTPSVADEARTWLDTLADAHGGQEPTLPVPVSPSPSNTVKVDNIPDSARELLWTWGTANADYRPSPGQVDALVAADQGVHTRTVRRWRMALLGA